MKFHVRKVNGAHREGVAMTKKYNSRGKTKIIDFLNRNNERRMTAGEILTGLNEEGNGINRSTVYRNLEKMVETGDVLSFKGSDSESTYYQYSGVHKECNAHLHIQCNTCGRIFHLEHGFIDEFKKHLLFDYGVEIDVAHTMMVGVCKECREKTV